MQHLEPRISGRRLGGALRPALAVLLPWVGACVAGGDLTGLGKTAAGNGPVVVWDPYTEPLPEIPFPNDIATRYDASAATARRVNVARGAPTRFERDLRGHIDELDGFGTFAPFWVRFASPDPSHPELGRLDLDRIRARQKGDVDFADDVVLVLNITPGSRTYGAAAQLDFGNGNYPVLLERTDEFFDNDTRPLATNVLFETYEEDTDHDGHLDVFEDSNQNGALDAGEDQDGDGALDLDEDTDGDGVFDHPNLWGTYADDPARLDPNRDLLTFYELETDTLWFRPLYPLEQGTTYAIVLLADLVGQNGDPVRSPFPFVHHLQQTEALRPLFEDTILQRYGRTPKDVAFAWSFTTQRVTDTLVALREGLYGYGKFAALADLYPPEIDGVVPMSSAPGLEAYMLRPTQLVAVLRLIFENLKLGDYDTTRVQQLINTYGAVDYVIAGDYTSPNLLDAGGGTFDIDLATGRVAAQQNSIRFLLAVPKKEYGHAPFPVALYCHGYTSLKLEALAFAGGLAKFGIATFAIDAPSHGLPLGGEYDVIINGLLEQLGGEGLLPFFDAIKKDRARDLNNDSLTEPGGDFWTYDMFHTRDIVRQTVVDYMQAIRVLRRFDGVSLATYDANGDGALNDLAGDFNHDGVPDIGGPATKYYVLGTSMGGINSSIIGAIDPAITTAAPISPGGGLLEVGLRTELGNVTRAVFLPLLGPMVISTPKSSDPRVMILSFVVADVFSKRVIPFASVGRYDGSGGVVDDLRSGDSLEVTNLDSGHVDSVVVPPDRLLRVPFAADKGTPLAITIRRPTGELVKEINTFEFEIEGFQGKPYAAASPLVSIQEGMGYRRGTPGFRRLIGISQMILEPGDPVNYGPLYANPIPVRPEGVSPTNVLFVITMGDMTVPVSSGMALARAAGIIDFQHPDLRYGVTQNQLLIDHHVIEAVDKLRYFEHDPCHYHPGVVSFDVDDLSDGRHPNQLPRLAEIVRPPECSDAAPPSYCATLCRPLPPLRAVAKTGRGLRAVRIPALKATGQHAIDLPDPTLPFDPSMFILNQVGLFLGSDGRILSDHACLAKNDCSVCAGDPACPPMPPAPNMESLSGE
ncbi:MAG: hypothetical protein HY903_20500 [Deltaproteobacteria bacterium]|nr:hypothetical protein [Deltaproteobacteria bacterium]